MCQDRDYPFVPSETLDKFKRCGSEGLKPWPFTIVASAATFGVLGHHRGTWEVLQALAVKVRKPCVSCANPCNCRSIGISEFWAMDLTPGAIYSRSLLPSVCQVGQHCHLFVAIYSLDNPLDNLGDRPFRCPGSKDDLPGMV
jgi:hypothetical protein